MVLQSAPHNGRPLSPSLTFPSFHIMCPPAFRLVHSSPDRQELHDGDGTWICPPPPLIITRQVSTPTSMSESVPILFIVGSIHLGDIGCTEDIAQLRLCPLVPSHRIPSYTPLSSPAIIINHAVCCGVASASLGARDDLLFRPIALSRRARLSIFPLSLFRPFFKTIKEC